MGAGYRDGTMNRPRAFTRGCRAAFLLAAVLSLAGHDSARADFQSAAAAFNRGEVATGIAEFESLASAGDARAQDALATIYLKGLGVPRNVDTAMSWYCMIAHQPEGGRGVMQAVWFLAEWFRTGGGIPGRHYNDGRRANEDPIRAYFWFSVMAKQKDLYRQVHEDSVRLGKIGMTAVGSALFDDEIAAVGEAVRKWRPERPIASPKRCLRIPAGVSPHTE